MVMLLKITGLLFVETIFYPLIWLGLVQIDTVFNLKIIKFYR